MFRKGRQVVLMSFKNIVRLSFGIGICLSASQAAYAQSATQGQSATQDQSAAPAQFDRTVEQYTCKDIVREAGSGRDVAVAFLHGYLLGKSGSSKFNIDTLQKQTDVFLERCLDNPKDKAEDVMMQIKK